MFFRNSCFIVWIFFYVHNVQADGKVSCFYNSSAQYRTIMLRVTSLVLTDAIPLCTHFVYGFLGIDEHTYQVKLLTPWMDSEEQLKKIKSEEPWLDTESGLKNLQRTIELRFYNPSLKFLLSVGGSLDPRSRPYFKVLETNESRAIFIKSLVLMVLENGYTGADLAWQFPTHDENKAESIHGFVKEHRKMFGYLVQELSAELAHHKRLLTLTVLPNVKADEYIDFDTIKNCVEHIHLMTYDYKTPERSPNEADYSAPLYYVENRNENRNVEQTVNWWIKRNVPAEKLLIAIPTFGRSWRIDNTTGSKMEPPLKANGIPKTTLAYPTDPGTVPYYEVCNFLFDEDMKNTSNPEKLKKVTDTKHHFGSYAYRREDGKYEGMWVSFEEPKTAAEKAKFVKRLRLGGVAIVDLSVDDYLGRCNNYSGDDFLILHAAVSQGL